MVLADLLQIFFNTTVSCRKHLAYFLKKWKAATQPWNGLGYSSP